MSNVDMATRKEVVERREASVVSVYFASLGRSKGKDNNGKRKEE